MPRPAFRGFQCRSQGCTTTRAHARASTAASGGYTRRGAIAISMAEPFYADPRSVRRRAPSSAVLRGGALPLALAPFRGEMASLAGANRLSRTAMPTSRPIPRPSRLVHATVCFVAHVAGRVAVEVAIPFAAVLTVVGCASAPAGPAAQGTETSTAEDARDAESCAAFVSTVSRARPRKTSAGSDRASAERCTTDLVEMRGAAPDAHACTSACYTKEFDALQGCLAQCAGKVERYARDKAANASSRPAASFADAPTAKVTGSLIGLDDAPAAFEITLPVGVEESRTRLEAHGATLEFGRGDAAVEVHVALVPRTVSDDCDVPGRATVLHEGSLAGGRHVVTSKVDIGLPGAPAALCTRVFVPLGDAQQGSCTIFTADPESVANADALLPHLEEACASLSFGAPTSRPTATTP